MLNNRINSTSKIDEKPLNVLGLDWDKGFDAICIRPLQQSNISYVIKVTKRNVVSEIARVFDPFWSYSSRNNTRKMINSEPLATEAIMG